MAVGLNPSPASRLQPPSADHLDFMPNATSATRTKLRQPDDAFSDRLSGPPAPAFAVPTQERRRGSWDSIEKPCFPNSSPTEERAHQYRLRQGERVLSSRSDEREFQCHRWYGRSPAKPKPPNSIQERASKYRKVLRASDPVDANTARTAPSRSGNTSRLHDRSNNKPRRSGARGDKAGDYCLLRREKPMPARPRPRRARVIGSGVRFGTAS